MRAGARIDSSPMQEALRSLLPMGRKACSVIGWGDPDGVDVGWGDPDGVDVAAGGRVDVAAGGRVEWTVGLKATRRMNCMDQSKQGSRIKS